MTATPPRPPDPRLDALQSWLEQLAPEFGLQPESIQAASVDASFRRYFRVACARSTHPSLIVMDAPPPQEATGPFVKIAKLLEQASVHAPQVLAHNETAGFVLLTDLGNTTYFAALTKAQQEGDAVRANTLMRQAIDVLLLWQQASQPQRLPSYDEAALRQELALFPDWFIAHHLAHNLTPTQSKVLQTVFDQIIEANLAQASVYVHRDYMPRNLMVCDPGPGVLDFQDARFGPISYDIASLMRDAFISWDEERILDWSIYYWERARAAGLPVANDFGQFWRDMEWMGLQRHLKVLGIFARIRYRDGKPHYLEDAPRFITYVRSVASRYDTLKPLLKLFDTLALGAPAARHGVAAT